MDIKSFISGIIVGALFMFLIKGCDSNPTVIKDCEGEFYALNETSDTTEYISHKTYTDTIPFYDTIPRYIEVPIKKPIKDSISDINTYSNPYEDSLLVGEITSKVDGVLVDQKFTYIPKFPKVIIKTDSIVKEKVITNTIELVEKKRKMFLGLEAGGNINTFQVSPTISFKDKKDNIFSYRYDLMNETHNIGFKKLIKFK